MEGDDISEVVYHGDTEESESDSDHERTEGIADILYLSSLCMFIGHPAKMLCMQCLVCLSHQYQTIPNWNSLSHEETCLNKGFFTRLLHSQPWIQILSTARLCPGKNLNKSYLVR